MIWGDAAASTVGRALHLLNRRPYGGGGLFLYVSVHLGSVCVAAICAHMAENP